MSARTPTITTLRQGIVSALSAIAAGSTYHNTLTGDDQVVNGIYGSPARGGVPTVMVGRPRSSSVHGIQIGGYTRTVTFPIVCWAPHVTEAVADKLSAAEKLAQDVAIAIEAAVNTPTGALHDAVISVIVNVADFDGAEGDIAAQFGAFGLDVSFDYSVRSGVGL